MPDLPEGFAPTDPYETAITNARNQYPWLGLIPAPIKLVTGKGPYMSESYGPEDQNNPERGAFTVQLRDQGLINDPSKWSTLLGRESIDYIARHDPTYQDIAQKFWAARTPEQEAFSRGRYNKEPASDRAPSFDDFMREAELQEYLGGYMVGWPEWKNRSYSPQQQKLLGQLRDYLGRKPSAAPAPALPEGFAPSDKSPDAGLPEGFAPSDQEPYTAAERAEGTSGQVVGLDEDKLAETLRPVLGGPGAATMANAIKNLASVGPYIAALGGFGRGQGGIVEEAAPSIRAGLTPAERAGATEAEIAPSTATPAAAPESPAAPAQTQGTLNISRDVLPSAEQYARLPDHPDATPSLKAEVGRLKPAVRDPDTGTVYAPEGARHHGEVFEKLPQEIQDKDNLQSGFQDSETGHYLTRQQAHRRMIAAQAQKGPAPSPQAKELLDVPAIRTPQGEVIAGERGMEHKDIIAQTPNLPAPVQHGFIDRNGNFLPRPAARALVNAVEGTHLGEGEPDSRQLFPAQKALPAPVPAEEIQPAELSDAQKLARSASVPESQKVEQRAHATATRRIAPALKVGEQVFPGQPGGIHSDIWQGLPPELQDSPDLVSGYIGPNGQFQTRAETFPEIPSAAVTPNVTPAEPDLAALGFESVSKPPPERFERSDVFEIPVNRATLDPQTFQYKVQVDPKTGVGKSLQGAKAFERDYAGIQEFYWDDESGKLYVSHGHHRFTKAQQSGTPTVRGVILDSGESHPDAILHNVTKEDARARGALINFADGKGTPVDAASYLRSKPDVTPDKLANLNVDISGEKLVQQAIGLRELSNPIWHDVTIGKLEPEYGAIIGDELPGRDRDQIDVYKTYKKMEAKGQPFTQSRLRNYIKLVKNAEMIKIEEATGVGKTKNMFGDEVITRSTFEEQADILSDVTRRLGTEGNVFGQAARQKARLERGGNIIDEATSRRISEEARSTLNILNEYGSKPGTNSNQALRQYAAHLAQKPGDRQSILQQAYDALIKAAEQDVPSGANTVEDDKTGKLF